METCPRPAPERAVDLFAPRWVHYGRLPHARVQYGCYCPTLPSQPQFQLPQSEGASHGLGPLLRATKHGAGFAPPHKHTELYPPPLSLKQSRQPALGEGPLKLTRQPDLGVGPRKRTSRPDLQVGSRRRTR